MKTMKIIGVSNEGGLGNFFADSFKDEYTVSTVARNEDKNLVDSDVIVLNMFNHQKPLAQTEMFRRLFENVRNDPSKTLVAIGSTIHYISLRGTYAVGKKILKDTLYRECLHTGAYKCKVLFLEPGSLDNKHGRPHENFHLKQAELAQVLRVALLLEQKFLHIIVRGGHAPNASH